MLLPSGFIACVLVILVAKLRQSHAGFTEVAGWEKRWTYAKLAVDHGKANIDSRSTSLDAKKSLVHANWNPDNRKRWYEYVDLDDAPRLGPLCHVFIAPPELNSDAIAHCSCSFVKPNLAITAAHCFVESGITPKSGHAVWLIQGDGKGRVDKMYSSYKRVIPTEWWFASEFALQSKAKAEYKNAYDTAFLKVKPADKSAVVYTLRKPTGSIGASTYTIEDKIMNIYGYPYDYKFSSAPITTTVKVTSVHNMLHENTYESKTECVGLAKGSSGGPMLMSETETLPKYPAIKDQLSMSVFGPHVQSAECIKGEFHGQGSFARVTDNSLKALELIARDDATAKAKVVKTNDNGWIEAELLI